MNWIRLINFDVWVNRQTYIIWADPNRYYVWYMNSSLFELSLTLLSRPLFCVSHTHGMTSRDSSKWRACLQATTEMQRKHSWPHVVSFVSVGFLKRLVSDIWTVFEGGQDRRPAPPRIKHVDSIDSRSYNKVCWMLSSYWLLPVGEIDGTYRLSINKPFQFQKYQKLQTKTNKLYLS